MSRPVIEKIKKIVLLLQQGDFYRERNGIAYTSEVWLNYLTIKVCQKRPSCTTVNPFVVRQASTSVISSVWKMRIGFPEFRLKDK